MWSPPLYKCIGKILYFLVIHITLYWFLYNQVSLLYNSPFIATPFCLVSTIPTSSFNKYIHGNLKASCSITSSPWNGPYDHIPRSWQTLCHSPQLQSHNLPCQHWSLITNRVQNYHLRNEQWALQHCATPPSWHH